MVATENWAIHGDSWLEAWLLGFTSPHTPYNIVFRHWQPNGISKNWTQTHRHTNVPTTRASHISFLRFRIGNLNYPLSINLSILHCCAWAGGCVCLSVYLSVHLAIWDCIYNCALLLHILSFTQHFNSNIITICMLMPQFAWEVDFHCATSLVFISRWIPFCEMLIDFWCDSCFSMHVRQFGFICCIPTQIPKSVDNCECQFNGNFPAKVCLVW